MPGKERTTYIPLDDRDPATVRAVILARDSGGDNMETQIVRCEAFITHMGWRLVAPRDAYTEPRTTGVKKVPRPGLARLLVLAERGELDAIVCSEEFRLDRNSDRRAVWQHEFRRFGVVFRFAEFADNGGTPSEDVASKIAAGVLSLLGEVEAMRIAARTWPGRERRFAAGYMGNGSAGPNYGYRWSQKVRTERGKNAVYELEPEEADRIRSWYERLDREEDLSLNKLQRELNAEGVPTPSGKPGHHWSVTVLSEMLRNPIYCGRGRLRRYSVTSTMEPDEHGEEWDKRQVEEKWRTHSEADYLAATLPMAEGAAPDIVPVDLWERVQAKIDHMRAGGGRSGRAGSPYSPDATLLHGRFIRCAACGQMMSINRRPSAHGRIPQYRCSNRPDDPHFPCQVHSVPAAETDALVRQLLAEVLADPERLADLADASADRLAHARSAVALADANVEGIRARLAELDKDFARLGRVLDALDPVREAEDVATYNAKRAKVAGERERLRADLAAATPRRDRAHQRAALLRLITEYEESSIDLGAIDAPGYPAVRPGAPVFRDEGPRVPAMLDPHQAAALMGNPPDLDSDEAYWYDEANLRDAGQWHLTPRARIVAHLLNSADVTSLRRLLRDLGVMVWVTRPRPQAERATAGKTPLAERVTVQIGDLRLRAPGSASVANATTLATWALPITAAGVQ